FCFLGASVSVLLFCFFFSCSVAHRDLHSFPTRRSSDLRLASAEAAIQAAFHLRPDDGETHLARAWNLYHGHLDYEGALAELEVRSEEHTSELQSRGHLVCRLLLEKKKQEHNQQQQRRRK